MRWNLSNFGVVRIGYDMSLTNLFSRSSNPVFPKVVHCSKSLGCICKDAGMGFPVRTKGTRNTEHMFSQWGLEGTGNSRKFFFENL